jgi:hypothetical protein
LSGTIAKWTLVKEEAGELNKHQQGLGLDQPAMYQIQVQGRLRANWSRWFDDMEITVKSELSGSTITFLTGEVADQSALHGLLNRIRDLGIPLISVQLIGPNIARSG